MSRVYVLLYIHTDNPEFSEVLGVYSDKKIAVTELLERANYRERNGRLTQYMQPTDEYKSYDELRAKVFEEEELVDHDIYRISAHECRTWYKTTEVLGANWDEDIEIVYAAK